MMDNGVRVTIPQPPPTTRFTHRIPNQQIAVISQFKLCSGIVLNDVPLAFKTWGELNADRNNCMVICHGLTASADVQEWWGPLLGPGLVLDPTRYFIFCANALGSPYGSASPITINPLTGKIWGPEFPATTVRDDVCIQKILLDYLGVRTVSVVIGGSMGGMACLEWPICTPVGYVLNIVPVATCPRHSAWGISWGEAQRQSIYSDPKFLDGYYDQDDPPSIGLAAARMAALLTYRSRDSFETRFGRNQERSDTLECPDNGNCLVEENQTLNQDQQVAKATLDTFLAHNNEHRTQSEVEATATQPTTEDLHQKARENNSPSQLFSAQSYLRYQGEKFVQRFDANCYIHLTRKLDSHDVDYGRSAPALRRVPPGALVIAINSDGLFTLVEQQELANSMTDSRLVVVQSPDGHDGFLIEFEQINRQVLLHLQQKLPHLYIASSKSDESEPSNSAPVEFKASTTENFGQVEKSITDW